MTHEIITKVAFLALIFLGAMSPAQAKERIEVVTTLNVLADLAERIGGDRIVVDSLADPRQDPHFVQPRPTLMKKARQADLFIEIGLQLELWAQKVVDGAGNSRIQMGQPGRVIASKGISTLELPSTLSREWGDVHPYGNPHVWLDPVNVKTMAKNIAAALQTIDPEHRDGYAARLGTFEHEIDAALFGKALVQDVGARRLTRLARQDRLVDYLKRKGLEDELGGWLAQSRKLRGLSVVTYHKTWAYFVSRFGLTVPIEIEEKPGISPSARHRDRVIEVMKQSNCKVIVISSFYDRAVADHIAARTGARVVQVPIDVGAVKGVGTYFELIDHLIGSIKAGAGLGDG